MQGKKKVTRTAHPHRKYTEKDQPHDSKHGAATKWRHGTFLCFPIPNCRFPAWLFVAVFQCQCCIPPRGLTSCGPRRGLTPHPLISLKDWPAVGAFLHASIPLPNYLAQVGAARLLLCPRFVPATCPTPRLLIALSATAPREYYLDGSPNSSRTEAHSKHSVQGSAHNFLRLNHRSWYCIVCTR